MRKRLALWQSKLKTAKAISVYIFGFIEIVIFFLSLYLLPKELWMVTNIILAVIPVTIAGILIWMYMDTRRELRAQKPKIQLNPLHSPIQDKKSNIIGIERIYDMLITTWDCPKYKTLMAQLNPIYYLSEKEPSQILLSPPIAIFRMSNVKPSEYTRKDAFLFQSTTKQMTIANQCPIKLKKGIDYETSLEIKDDKHTLETINYLIRLKQLTNSITDLVIEDIEVLEAGGE